jgi:hypothetical protein
MLPQGPRVCQFKFSVTLVTGVSGYLASRAKMIPTRNMKLHNFEICSSIEFQSGGLFWDVHNLASFDGLELIRAGNVAVMRWSVPSAASNPWGGLGNRFVGMELHFKNLVFLLVGARGEKMPMSEDSASRPS